MAPLARPHNHLSNRAKVRATLERKPVFKSVLENPFQISWPSVSLNVQNAVLARLVAALENVPSRTHASRNFSHKRGGSSHRGGTDTAEEEVENALGASPHLVIGINAVTRALELQLRLGRKHVVVNGLSHMGDQVPPLPAPPPIGVVFVCCVDVDPTALIDHIPYLVAGCNSSKNAMQPIKLVPLPKGSEPTISQILGVRRAAVVAFRVRDHNCNWVFHHSCHSSKRSPLFETVQDILDPVPTISAPWLCPESTQCIPQLVPTHIKQLRTSAPKDMKGAREQRAKAKKSASRTVRRKHRVTLTTGSED